MKRFCLISLIMVAVLLLTSVPVVALAPDGNQGKGPIDKIVFVHYPKHEAARPAPGGIKLENQLSPTYKYSGIRWQGDTIEYAVNPANSDVDSASTLAAIQASFETWDLASGRLTFNFLGTTTVNAGGLDGHNIVSWGPVSYSNAIAVTYIWYYRNSKIIYECDTIMNNELPWEYTSITTNPDLSAAATPDSARYIDPSNYGASGYYDIRNIMTHEAGHWILLGDLYNTRDSYLTMYGYGSTGEIEKDTLGYGDELGVEKAYGN